MPLKPRSAKAKGTRLEKDIAGQLAAIPGWSARRQPLSGALIEFPSDVQAEHEELGRFLVECKNHKNPMTQVRKWLGKADWLITRAEREPDPVVHIRWSAFLRLLER